MCVCVCFPFSFEFKTQGRKVLVSISWPGISLENYTCLRYGNDEFLDVDGGTDRACRGATEADNDPSHYTVSSGSLEECKQACRDNLACVGIEHAGTRSLASVWICDLFFLLIVLAEASYGFIVLV